MTSSLVGSEMCIRDRGDLACDFSSHGDSLLASSPRFAERNVNNRTTPVSYTHLTLPTICSV
eukprot:4674318-Prorocentrum_lima.AAC.1